MSAHPRRHVARAEAASRQKTALRRQKIKTRAGVDGSDWRQKGDADAAQHG